MAIWLLIFTFLLCAVALAFSGVWRRAGKNLSVDQERDQQMYHARLSEIDMDFDLGRIDAEARDAAKAEQARILLRLSQTATGETSTSPSITFAIIAAAMLFVPALSLVLYLDKGNPDVGYLAAETPEQDGQASFEDLMASAEQQLAENPDDLRGWRVVAPVYMRTGQFDKAATAFRNMIRLGETGTDTRRALAEVLVVLNDNQVTDEALELFRLISQELPQDIGARFFIAEGALQRGNRDEARIIWEKLRDEAQGEEPWLPTVLSRLQELDGVPAATPAFSPEQLERIEGMVSGLASRLDDDPQDKDGWIRLVRSYMVLNRPDDALAAYQKASGHFPQDPQFVSGLKNMIDNFAQAEESQ